MQSFSAFQQKASIESRKRLPQQRLELLDYRSLQFDGLTHPDGSPYAATTAWKDLFATLEAAERFIYITGWSVFTQIELVRGDDDRHVLQWGCCLCVQNKGG